MAITVNISLWFVTASSLLLFYGFTWLPAQIKLSIDPDWLHFTIFGMTFLPLLVEVSIKLLKALFFLIIDDPFKHYNTIISWIVLLIRGLGRKIRKKDNLIFLFR